MTSKEIANTKALHLLCIALLLPSVTRNDPMQNSHFSVKDFSDTLECPLMTVFRAVLDSFICSDTERGTVDKPDMKEKQVFQGSF